MNDTALYCCDDVDRFGIGDNQSLIHSKTRHSFTVIGNDLATLLLRCNRFRTIEAHAREYLRGYRQPDVALPMLEMITQQLHELVATGLLINKDELRQYCLDHAAAADSNSRIDSIGIVTQNRPEDLQRCLTSFIENTRKFGRNNEFVVVDDSEEYEERNTVRQRLLALANASGVKIRYAGFEEKTDFVRALSNESQVPIETLNFALFDPEGFGCSIGANRNALLLDMAGKICLSVDDDVRCRLSPGLDYRPALAIEPLSEFMNIDSFANRAATLETAGLAEVDVLATHEQLLGRTLNGCVKFISDQRGVLDFDFVNAQFLKSLETNSGKVIVTFTGLIGDPGVDIPAVLQPLNRQSHENLMRTESEYNLAFQSRELFKSPSSMVLSRRGSFITAAFGFDGRSLLPPFFPLLRGHDGTFAATLHTCFEGYWGYLPWGILHDSRERRYSEEGVKETVSSLRLSNVLMSLINDFQLSTGIADEEERMSALGRHLSSLGRMRLSEFDEYLRIRLLRSQTAYLSLMEKQLALFSGRPSYWSEDVKWVTSLLSNALSDDSYYVPKDLVRAQSLEEARKLTQRLVSKFGELMSAWPQIFKAASTLKAKGVLLGRPV